MNVRGGCIYEFDGVRFKACIPDSPYPECSSRCRRPVDIQMTYK